MRRYRHSLIGFAAFLAVTIPVPSASQARDSAHSSIATWRQNWPMAGHDPQRTNSSPVTGPRHPRLRFTHMAVGGLPPVIGADGHIVVWSSHALISLDPTGHARRLYNAVADSPPALGPDGTTVVKAFTNGRMSLEGAVDVGITADGHAAWTVRNVGFAKNVPPLVRANGTAFLPYVGPTEANARLDRISPSGQVQTLQPRFSFDAVAVGPTGSIYAIGRYSSHEDSLSIERMGADSRVVWRHTLEYQGAGLLVGRRGTVYVSDGESVGYSGTASVITAYTATGGVLWRIRTSQGTAALALRADGVLLVAGQRGLSAIGPHGRTLWRTSIGRSSQNAIPSIAVDALGTAYVGSGDGLVRIVSRQGMVVGQLYAGPPSTLETPEVALGVGHGLVVAGTDSLLRVYGASQ